MADGAAAVCVAAPRAFVPSPEADAAQPLPLSPASAHAFAGWTACAGGGADSIAPPSTPLRTPASERLAPRAPPPSAGQPTDPVQSARRLAERNAQLRGRLSGMSCGPR